MDALGWSNGSEYKGTCMAAMAATDDRLTLSMPSNPQYLGVLRSFFRSLLYVSGFPETEADAMILAIHEACTNVMQHGYGGDTTQRIDLTVRVTAAVFTVEIQDYGAQQDVSAIQPRALHEVRPGGLGTHFMRAIMDEVTYSSSDTGTLVRMTKRRSISCAST
jgi:anti-sigma regulatory factor (Ser/Thr protein kinase)